MLGHHQLQAAHHGGGHVVGVALNGGGHFQQVTGREFPTVTHHRGESIGGGQPSGDGGGAAAQPAGQRYLIVTAYPQRRHGAAQLAVQELHGTVDQVFRPVLQFARPLAGDADRWGCALWERFHFHGVPDVQGHAEAVVAGAEVGGGGWGGNANGSHTGFLTIVSSSTY